MAATPATSATAPVTSMAGRQPAASTAQARGTWPTTAPATPAPTVRPLSKANRIGGNHTAARLSATTKVAPPPIPISNRPMKAPGTVSA